MRTFLIDIGSNRIFNLDKPIKNQIVNEKSTHSKIS